MIFKRSFDSAAAPLRMTEVGDDLGEGGAIWATGGQSGWQRERSGQERDIPTENDASCIGNKDIRKGRQIE